MKEINLTTAIVAILIFLTLPACEPRFFHIPTSAMEGTLMTGDRIWMSTDVPQRNDIMVFIFPGDMETYYVKRMVAAAGDTIKIDSTVVYINSRKQDYPPTIQHQYFLQTETSIRDRVFTDNGIREYAKSMHGYMVFSNEAYIEFFENVDFVEKVRPMTMAADQEDEYYFYADFEGWNRDYFGPLYIPKAGDVITKDQFDRYRETIRQHEGEDLTGLSEYQFKKSYCFGMGDNRHNSLDSRYWGLVPMELVKGVATHGTR